MNITISPKAEKKLKKILKFDQIAIGQKVRSLGVVQNSLDEEKLSGFKDVYRIRVGDYRIIYRRFSQQIYIIVFGHRKEVYDILNRLL